MVRLRQAFPSLTDFTVTSQATRDYNCIAWAAGTNTRWWEPDNRYYWPPGAPRNYSVGACMTAFNALGYEPCLDGTLVEGFEKVVIYADSNGVTHMARQRPNGRWTSKLGQHEDIEHATPAELEGNQYGFVVQYMHRRRRLPSERVR